jgi:hypothetical protein
MAWEIREAGRDGRWDRETGERLELIKHKMNESKVYEERESSFQHRWVNHRERDVAWRVVSLRHHFHEPPMASWMSWYRLGKAVSRVNTICV